MKSAADLLLVTYNNKFLHSNTEIVNVEAIKRNAHAMQLLLALEKKGIYTNNHAALDGSVRTLTLAVMGFVMHDNIDIISDWPLKPYNELEAANVSCLPTFCDKVSGRDKEFVLRALGIEERGLPAELRGDTAFARSLWS